MNRGKPFEPGNTFGKGRPRGSRNKFRPEAKQLLDEYSLALMKTMIKLGLEKDAGILKVLAPLLMKSSDQRVNLGKMAARTAADIDRATEKLFQMGMTGQITFDQWIQLSEILEKRRKAIVTADLEQRIGAMERRE